MTPFYTLAGVPPNPHPSFATPFTTSWLLSPLLLTILRAIFTLYALLTIILDFALHPSAAGSSFSYFTNLTYWGLFFYLLVATIHTATHGAYLNKFPRSLQAANTFLYTTITTLPPLVTIVYWAILSSNFSSLDTSTTWTTISKHALNTLISVIEIVLPTTNPPPPFHLVGLILILALYLALAYITHATQGFYTYDFLDPDNGGVVAGYVAGIGVGICVVFGVVWGITWLRRRFTKGKVKDGNTWRRRQQRVAREDGVVEMRHEVKT